MTQNGADGDWTARAWRDDLRNAIAFLTRIPMPHPDGARPANLARAQRAFPIVAAGIGLAIGAVYAMLSAINAPSVAASALALGAGMLLTGALHEDGLADVADGFGGGRDRAAKLEIMRDSRLGTYGALAIVVAFAAKAASIASLRPADALVALIVAHTLARAAIPAMALLLTNARSDGLAATAEPPSGSVALTACLLALGVALALLPFALVIPAVIAAAFGAAAVSWIAQRQIGGVTGDVYGAAEQVAETAVLVLLASRLAA